MDPYVIEARPTSARERMRRWLRGRRLMLAGVLALAEIIAFFIWRPSTVLFVTAAVLVLILGVMAATRVRAGLLRDVLWIVAIAQGLVVFIPLVVGISIVAAMVVAIGLIVALVAIAARWRV
ncbi:MAG: hypothetical protein AB7V62_09470 [Thermoleophilia bacterium]